MTTMTTTKTITIFGREITAPTDLIEASGIETPYLSDRYRQVFAGHLGNNPGRPDIALMLTAGDRAEETARNNALTAEQKIAEIKRAAAADELAAAKMKVAE